VTPPLLELTGVVKNYHGLRPLRIAALSVAAGETVAVLGIDGSAAEVLVNVVTGAMLPDSGEVRLLGRPTSAIADSDEWLRTVDQVGLVSGRAVLLESLSVVQNLAMPFSLEIEPPSPALREQASALAAEVGISSDLDGRVAELDEASKILVRLGRALALCPPLVIVEHPTETIERAAVPELGKRIRRVIEGRGAAGLTLTGDEELARHVAGRILKFEPSSGRLAPLRRRWLGF
jgi:ABC-type lipoprotein export system ATPase subunit